MSPAPDKKSLLSRLGDAARKSEKGTLTVSVRVQPRASKKGVEGVRDGALRVRLTAPPAEGAANAQLVEVLSKEFGIKKSAIKIVKGHSSRDKLVELEDAL
jgi:uncharacterized protein (TIGR00251 family)